MGLQVVVPVAGLDILRSMIAVLGESCVGYGRLQRRRRPAKHWPQHSRSRDTKKRGLRRYNMQSAFAWHMTQCCCWLLQVPCKLRPGLDDELDGVAARRALSESCYAYNPMISVRPRKPLCQGIT